MADDLHLSDDEIVVADERFQASKNAVFFRMVVTSHAVFVTRRSRLSVKQPGYLERIPLEDVHGVSLRPVKPYKSWMLSGLFLLIGIGMLVGMYQPSFEGKPSGWPFALIVGGIVIPFAVRGRNELVLRIAGESYRWRPDINVDRKSRAEVRRIQESLVEACESLGLRVDTLVETGSRRGVRSDSTRSS